MRFYKQSLIAGIAATLTGCGNPPVPENAVQHPFEGCWQNESGLDREVWVSDPSGWMFGYSLSRGEEGDITFFEHMRIEKASDVSSLVVIGSAGDIVRFEREATEGGDAEFKFVNASHDYPQVITYWPSDKRLDAQISLIDGSEPRDFKKRVCDSL